MQYAYVSIERLFVDRVSIPGLADFESEFQTGEDALRAWWEANVHHADPVRAELRRRHEAAVLAWEEEFERFRDATTVTETQGQMGFRVDPVKLVRIVYPDGTVDDRKIAGPAAERIRGRFTALHPLPPAPDLPDAGGSESFDIWRQSVRPTVRRARVWRAYCFEAGRARQLEFTGEGDRPLPIDQIPGLLDALAANGWRVENVSEDHRTVNDDIGALVVRARFLLRRESP